MTIGSNEYDMVWNKVVDSKVVRTLGALALVFGIYKGYENMPARFQEESDLETAVTEEVLSSERVNPYIGPGVRKVTPENEEYIRSLRKKFEGSMYTAETGETLWEIAPKYWAAINGKWPRTQNDWNSARNLWRESRDYRESLEKNPHFILENEVVELPKRDFH
mgnify:CR=1 FL=1